MRINELDIYTDDSCNLSKEWLAKHEVEMLELSVTLDGEECPREVRDDLRAFYSAIRNGAHPSTSAVPRGQIEEAFRRSMERGRDILYVGLPAKLSSNFEQMRAVAKEVVSGYHQRICCMDARSATMGLAIMIEEAVRLRDEGQSSDAIRNTLEKLSDHIRILFMLDDPQYLKAGGRGEKALEHVARFISKLSIKPLLTINRQCSIKFHSAHRSRKRALERMMEYLQSMIDRVRDQTVYVAHADALPLAEMAVDQVRKTLGAQQRVAIAEVPPLIGAHVGPGAIALIFQSAQPRT
ncbi:MAG: DegV family protein [Coriobacteriales bacterium]|nr:DegV family protein [Coriobacteriales bacterium]